MLWCTEISFVISFFNFEKIGVKPGFPFMQLNQATYSKLGKKSNFDMFYKNDCWAVICYPICMTNERGIIVLSFPDIRFVILLFVFQRFEIKSGFPFFNSHCTVIHWVWPQWKFLCVLEANPETELYLFFEIAFLIQNMSGGGGEKTIKTSI